MSDNPYHFQNNDSSPDIHSENFLCQPKKVPFINGYKWFVDAWGIFIKTPGFWVVFFLAYLITSYALSFFFSLIPLGNIFYAPFQQVFAGFIIVVCYKADHFRRVDMRQSFNKLKPRIGDLLIVGIIYIGLIFAILMIVAIFMSVMAVITGVFANMDLGNINPQEIENLVILPSGGINPQIINFIFICILLLLAFILPLAMAIWFAPVLIVLHNVKPLMAMKLSFKACIINMLPFLLYGVVWLGLFIIAVIPLFLGLLVLGPILILTIYTSYKDIFNIKNNREHTETPEDNGGFYV